jgi:hypothetical protein
MVADIVQSYIAMRVICLQRCISNSLLDFFPENIGAVNEEHRDQFHQNITPWKSGTKASGASVCWLIIAGHLEMFHRQNTAESHPLLLFR